MLQHKVVSVFNLFVNCSCKFLTSDKDITYLALEYCTLYGGIWKVYHIAVQKKITIGWMANSLPFYQQFP